MLYVANVAQRQWSQIGAKKGVIACGKRAVPQDRAICDLPLLDDLGAPLLPKMVLKLASGEQGIPDGSVRERTWDVPGLRAAYCVARLFRVGFGE